jgi:GTP-binding protein EngB required for normal cell division
LYGFGSGFTFLVFLVSILKQAKFEIFRNSGLVVRMVLISSIEKSKYEAQRLLIDTLRLHGVGHHLQLPQIAVVGDTSCGKSSLLSSISGIEFPSSSKLTTRCPTQLIMTNASDFSGKVRVIRAARKEDEPVTEEVVNDISEIPDVISKLTLQLCGKSQQFTEDSISIEVRGPTFPNLTLIDLPGLVRYTKDGENPENKDLVKNMVRKYIAEERTVILAVAQANVDLHNTEILEYAKEFDPQGRRSFCVFTKMDLVDDGSERDVIEHISTNKTAMKFHIVKSRGQQDLDEKVTVEQAIVKERDFFVQKSIWTSSLNSELIGIPNLKNRLGRILQEIISHSFADVLKELDCKITECKDRLIKLGPELNSSESRRRIFYQVAEKISSFVRQGAREGAQHIGKNEEQKDKLSLAWRIAKLETCFMQEIMQTRVVSLGDLQVGDLVEFLDEDSTPKFYREGTIGGGSGDEFRIQPKGDGTIVSKVPLRNIRLNLGELKKMIEWKRGNRLPLFPIYEVFENLVVEFVERWNVPALNFQGQAHSAFVEFLELVLDLIEMPPCLRKSMRDRCLQLVEESFRYCQEQLERCFLRERDPYTINHHYLYTTLDDLRMKPFRSALKQIAHKDLQGREVVNVDSVFLLLKNTGGMSAAFEDREAVELNNALAAYVKVAKKRFADNVVLVFRNDFLKDVEGRFSRLAFTVGDDVLEEWMEEDLFTIQERERCKQTLASLEEGKKQFNQLKRQHLF